MRKNNWIIGGISGLIISAGFINSSFLWALSIMAVFLYAEARTLDNEKLIEEKEKVMGNRLIEATKTLADLIRNSFDHIKSQASKIEKINAKLGDHTAKLHRYDINDHRLVNQGKQKTSGEEIFNSVAGIKWPTSTPRSNNRRIDQKFNGPAKIVRDTTDKS